MNFGPKNIFKGTKSNGKSIRVEEWDYSTLAGSDLIGIFGKIFLGVFVGCIMSPILALQSIFRFGGQLKVICIIGIILSGFFLYECYIGGIILTAINIFLSEKPINFLVCINIISLLVHVFLLFNSIIYLLISKLFKTEKSRTEFFIILLVILCTLAYKLTSGNLKEAEGWVKNNINTNLISYYKK